MSGIRQLVQSRSCARHTALDRSGAHVAEFGRRSVRIAGSTDEKERIALFVGYLFERVLNGETPVWQRDAAMMATTRKFTDGQGFGTKGGFVR